MIDIIGRRKIWYSISAAVLIPGLVLLGVFGLELGIDFTGGSNITVETELEEAEVRELVEAEGVTEPTLLPTDAGYQIRFTEDIDIEAELAAADGVAVERFERVGPSVSQDLVYNALWSLLAVSLAITIFVAFAFRKVQHPFSFGAMAITALLHDGLFVLVMFALFGALFGVEVDAFIVTAILTVIGFSVHDTIVVFDRIRENLLRRSGEFADIVNASVNEVMGRSLNTSITTVLVLLALFLFGGQGTVTFILALLLGMVAGTYSSLFIASPLLVTWFQRRGEQPAAEESVANSETVR